MIMNTKEQKKKNTEKSKGRSKGNRKIKRGRIISETLTPRAIKRVQ